MRAALFDEIENMTMIEQDRPKIKTGEVLIKVTMTGICGSEIHAYEGNHPFRNPPAVLGHELVGVIEEIADDVSDLKVGQLVTVEPQIGCGTCIYCEEGNYNVCDNKTVLGTDQWIGSFAEYIKAPSQTVYAFSNHVNPQVGVLTEPLAVGVHAAKLAEIEPGDKVAILGGGTIGLLTGVVAKYYGASEICITDTLENNLNLAKELFNADTINVSQESVSEFVRKNYGHVDKVFLTVGMQSIISEAINITKKKGTVISIAIFEDEKKLDFNKLFLKELKLFGSSMYIQEDFQKAVEIISENEYPFHLLSKYVYDLEQIEYAFEVAMTKKDGAIKVLLEP